MMLTIFALRNKARSKILKPGDRLFPWVLNLKWVRYTTSRTEDDHRGPPMKIVWSRGWQAFDFMCLRIESELTIRVRVDI